jgi:Flp pilus assembly protein protease CpaA
MDLILDYLVAENDFFGMTVQNWMVILAFVFFIWLFATYISPRTSAKWDRAPPAARRHFV